ncbi:apolipoprotein N-acyltransferase [Anabaena cylindrica UHCC 0172]|uniref:apolipoprotein N-acyltransferase n=1 Tax=Anabaena cylindrica TaxID=1165 RepID=UPI002B213D71|nr:apolipoprotein N-acyltransferase [Anabaena cylindrica]MEA5550052.1 apolipoprotein N-acyltransferase [Anabaena cylindrica UHCC 0172]
MKSLEKKLFSSLHLYTLSLISGLLMGVTVAPVGAWFLAWVALAPLWVLVVKYTKNTIPPAFLWAIAYHGVALSWITGIYPMDWLGVPALPALAITLFCWSFISLWGGILVSIWAVLMVRLDKQKPWLRVLVGTGLWCALESLWSASPLWWSSLAYTQSPHNLVILHLGQLSGTSTVTAVIVAVNGLVAEAWIYYEKLTQRRKGAKEERNFREGFVNRYLFAAFSLLMITHFIGFIIYNQPIDKLSKQALKIGVVQGNIPNKIKLLPEGFNRAITGYTEGYLELANQGVNGVLTPEGALPIYESNFSNTPLVAAIREKAVVAWIGAFGKRGKSYTNSLFTVFGNGEVTSRYDKSKLVPLGEYIPFEQILGALVQRLSPLDEHQVHGSPNQVFDTPFGRAIVGICYESAFPEIFRRQALKGGQFILSSSNDAHYTSAMSDQHHAQDIMRAIETDRWAVRATNTGYSAFVDPHGRTLWKSGYNTYETHAETIYRRQTQTLYVRWGDWLMPLLLILGFLGWVLL